MKHRVLLLLLLLRISMSQAQNILGNVAPEGETPVSKTTPGGNDIYDVDLFSGTANITVPIYSYQVDGLDLGVSLSCNTSGIRVDDYPGSVGSGWELNYGGAIIREAIGLEDEVTLPGNPPYASAWAIIAPQSNELFNPDQFSASFGGRSLKFSLEPNYPSNLGIISLMKTSPKSNVIIDFNIFLNETTLCTACNNIRPRVGDEIGSQENAYFIGFQLADEYGNTFVFKRGDYERRQYDFPQLTPPTGTYYPTQKWVPDYILTYTGQKITYEYEFINISYPLSKKEEITEYYTALNAPDYPVVQKNETVMWNGRVALIKQINYPNGVKVKFNYASQCTSDIKALETIEIESGYDQTVKNVLKYRLNHAYSVAGQTATAPYPMTCTSPSELWYTKRLRLTGIDRIGTDNLTTEGLYRFDYETTPLPNRLAPSKDIYGYYNGKTTVPLTIITVGSGFPPQVITSVYNLETPYHSYQDQESLYEYGLDRSSDINYAKAGALKTITNGMGGEIEFNYKAHVLTTQDPIDDQDLIGANVNDGLCIDKIVEKDGFGNNVTNTYDFQGGQRFYRGGYFWIPISVQPYTGSKTWYNFMVSPYETNTGFNHGYSTAAVWSRGYNNELLSHKEYKFCNWQFDLEANDPSLQPSFSTGVYACHLQYGLNRHTIRRRLRYSYPGVLLEEKNFDLGGSLASKTKYHYQRTIHPDQNRTDAYFWGTSWRNTSTIATSYSGTASQVTEHTNTYASYIYDDIRSVSWKDSKNNTCEKKYEYLYQTINGANRLQITKEQTWKHIGTNSYLVEQSTAGFSNPAQSPLITQSVASTTLSAPLQLTSQQPVPPQYLVQKNYSSRDQNLAGATNNVTETYFPKEDRYNATIWDTRIGEKLAEATNAKYTEIAYTSFEGSFIGGFDYNKGNWTFNPNSVVLGPTALSTRAITGRYYFNLSSSSSVVSLNPLAQNKKFIVSLWATNNPSITYNSITYNLTPLFQVNGWKFYSQVVTGVGGTATLRVRVPMGGNPFYIDELRLHPLDASMTTSAYEPLIGASSICTGGTSIIYQEYDAMGRPRLTRDINGNIITMQQHVRGGGNN